MFELMVDGNIVPAPDAATIQALCKQGKVNGETPIRKKGSEKWSRVKNLKTNSKAQDAPASTQADVIDDASRVSNEEFIHVVCLNCGKTSKVRRNLEGKAFRCKNCGEVVNIRSSKNSERLASKPQGRLHIQNENRLENEPEAWDEMDSD